MEIANCRVYLQKDHSSLLFGERTIFVDIVKELPFLTIFHKDVDLFVFLMHLVDLSDVLVHQIFMYLYLSPQRIFLRIAQFY